MKEIKSSGDDDYLLCNKDENLKKIVTKAKQKKTYFLVKTKIYYRTGLIIR